MRKSNREVTDRARIIDIMDRCDCCSVAFNDAEAPYIVTLNFGYEAAPWVAGDGPVCLYFHSALEGYKVELMKRDPNVAFAMNCGHELQYSADGMHCTMFYESISGKGRVHICEGDEKLRGLRLIMKHYHPEGDGSFSTDPVPVTLVWCIEVSEVTAKRKAPKA